MTKKEQLNEKVSNARFKAEKKVAQMMAKKTVQVMTKIQLHKMYIELERRRLEDGLNAIEQTMYGLVVRRRDKIMKGAKK